MSEYEKQKRQKMITLTVLLALSVLFGILSLFLGRYPKAGLLRPFCFIPIQSPGRFLPKSGFLESS